MLQPKARHAFGPSKVVAGGIPRQQGGRAPAASLRNGANLPVPSCAAEDMSFPFGPGRICHPFNFNRFDIRHESCEGLYAQRAILHPGWWLQLGVLSKLAAEVQNCSSVQSCGLGKLFLFTGALTSPGYDLRATVDRVVFSYHSRLEEKVRSLQRKHILAVLHQHRSFWPRPLPCQSLKLFCAAKISQ